MLIGYLVYEIHAFELMHANRANILTFVFNETLFINLRGKGLNNSGHNPYSICTSEFSRANIGSSST